MPTPIRILRAHFDDIPNARPRLSTRELEREDRILEAARVLMARFGRGNLTFNGLAIAMRLAPATIRRHFPDLDTILTELLVRHLRAISRALGEIPFDHPNRLPALRAAYVAFTRNGFSGTTEIHTLLIRERHFLPPDLAARIEHLRDLIGQNLATDHVDTTLILLDNPFLEPAQIEAMLATLANPAPAPLKLKPIVFSKHGRPVLQKPQKIHAPSPQARAGPGYAPPDKTATAT
jgi:AcrR family transcriptional regulator